MTETPRSAGPLVTFHEIADTGDHRGASYSSDGEVAAFLGAARDLHVATILPGKARGNHFHAVKREIIVVIATLAWDLHWDEGADTEPRSRRFEGGGAVLVRVMPGASHAIFNRGEAPLTIIGLSDRDYDPAAPDAVTRIVTPHP